MFNYLYVKQWPSSANDHHHFGKEVNIYSLDIYAHDNYINNHVTTWLVECWMGVWDAIVPVGG